MSVYSWTDRQTSPCLNLHLKSACYSIMIMRMGFSLWSECCHSKEPIRARQPPMVPFHLWRAQQQVNAAHTKETGARMLIIKEARFPFLTLSSLMIAISSLIILFSVDSARLSSTARWYTVQPMNTRFQTNCIIAFGQWRLHHKAWPCTVIADDNASSQQSTLAGVWYVFYDSGCGLMSVNTMALLFPAMSHFR